MSAYSPAVALIWQIAATETAYAKFQYIEREQLFIGLLKARVLLQPEIVEQIGLSIGNMDELREELDLLDDIFSRLGIDQTKLRRLIRALVGEGNFEHTERVVHRSEACKGFFNHAMEIAERDNSQNLKVIYLLQAILQNPGPHIHEALKNFAVGAEEIKKIVLDLIGKEKESVGARIKGEGREEESGAKRSVKMYLLDRYGTDLTKLVREGKIEPLIGRRKELLQVIRTLSRKTKNNPLLIGDAGVGKTAIVRGLAQRIVSQNITPTLRDKRVIELTMGTLVAGTKYRGEFEERLIGIIKEIRTHPEIIIFIDEIHTVVSAGKAEGSLDAANIMKPALAQGEISCIGATTLSEYRKYIEKDAALERRFQPIIVDEPTVEESLKILEGLKEKYEAHHRVEILNPALKAAVELSVRYLPDRYLPDKALDLLDEACTRVKVDSLSFHGKIDDVRMKTGQVTEEIVAQVLADWTGLPVTRLTSEEGDRLINMDKIIKKRVIGQDEAVEKVAQVIRMARAGLKDPKNPVGVFLFLGPTGVGKTELVKATAEFLFSSEDHMIRLDMSEYMEKHSVSKLIGAPPGYIGYEEEGQLTGRLRRKPYSVILLDEIEKAHPEVLDIFLQVFDEGRLTDSKGRTVDAKNAIFIMTSNLGGDIYRKQGAIIGFHHEESESSEKEVKVLLKKSLRPEFLNRIDEIVFFQSLGMEQLTKIATNMLDSLQKRLKEQGISLKIKKDAMVLLCEKGYDPINGARPLERTIERLIAKPLSEKLLKDEFKEGDLVVVDMENGEIVFRKRDDAETEN